MFKTKNKKQQKQQVLPSIIVKVFRVFKFLLHIGYTYQGAYKDPVHIEHKRVVCLHIT